MKRIVVPSLVVLLFAPWALEADGVQQRDRERCCQSTTDAELLAGTLSEQEIADLLFMREEEKLAHDLYLSFFDIWGHQVFEKIAISESRHMAAMLRAINMYGLEDPAAGNPIGVFDDPVLQQLYGDLFLAGSLSLVGALQAGALVEEKDIIDLQAAIATTDNQDLDRKYGKLLLGSSKHLRAFDRQLVKRGIVYEPLYLTQEEYDDIVAAR